MALPPKLESELVDLRELFVIEVTEDPSVINLVFKGFPLGDGFSIAASDLLIRVPRTYPDAGPDMFWLDPSVTLSNGTVPQAANAFEDYIGRRWQRFSWHWQAPWNPNVSNMHAYIEFVRRRLRDNH